MLHTLDPWKIGMSDKLTFFLCNLIHNFNFECSLWVIVMFRKF
jgi:hypothetical protein